jgi:hypothetical protein
MMAQTSFKRDASASSYPRTFFTEIFCSFNFEVSQELSEALRANDPDANDKLLHAAEERRHDLTSSVNFLAGLVGLRFHRQFVIHQLNENYIALLSPTQDRMNYSSPWLETLDNVSLNGAGLTQLDRLLSGLHRVPREKQDAASAALDWLLRAWGEEDALNRFVALFIPLEMVLDASGESTPSAEGDKIKALRQLAQQHASPESKRELVDFLNGIAGRLRPSLEERFEAFARNAQMETWRSDVTAFKVFNGIRNRNSPQGRQFNPIAGGDHRGTKARA